MQGLGRAREEVEVLLDVGLHDGVLVDGVGVGDAQDGVGAPAPHRQAVQVPCGEDSRLRVSRDLRAAPEAIRVFTHRNSHLYKI